MPLRYVHFWQEAAWDCQHLLPTPAEHLHTDVLGHYQAVLPGLSWHPSTSVLPRSTGLTHTTRCRPPENRCCLMKRERLEAHPQGRRGPQGPQRTGATSSASRANPWSLCFWSAQEHQTPGVSIHCPFNGPLAPATGIDRCDIRAGTASGTHGRVWTLQSAQRARQRKQQAHQGCQHNA